MKSNELGKNCIVEECQKLDIHVFLKTARLKLKEILIHSELSANGLHIEVATSKTGFGGIRYWFKCPLCGLRVGTLFIHPISKKLGCRACLGLEYRKRRYKGMVENLSI